MDRNEQAWLDHCAEMKRRYDVRAAELIAEGWQRRGRGRNEYFTSKDQAIVIRRQLGSGTWYTTQKDF